MLARRMLIFVVVLMGLSALAVSIAPPPTEQRRRAEPVATPTPTPAAPRTPATAEPASIPGEPPVTVLSAQERDQVVQAKVGDRVRLQVTSTTLDAVQLGEDGPMEAVDPESPAEFELFVDQVASQPITLVDSGQVIGTLEVRGDR